MNVVCPSGEGPGFFEVTFDRFFSGSPKRSKIVKNGPKTVKKNKIEIEKNVKIIILNSRSTALAAY